MTEQIGRSNLIFLLLLHAVVARLIFVCHFHTYLLLYHQE